MRIGWKLPSNNNLIASVRFRGLTPMASLKQRGVEVEIFDEARITSYEVVIVSKAYDRHTLQLVNQLKANGQRVIFDLSDNHYYNPKNIQQYVEAGNNLDCMISRADLVTTCSDYLADIIRDRPSAKCPVVLVEDAVEKLDVVRGNARSKTDQRLRLLWFGSHGSPNSESGLADLQRLNTHLSGVQLPEDSLLTVISNNQAAYQKVASNLAVPSRYVDWDQDKFCNLLSSTDVVVLPITNSPFSNSKSNNRVATPLWFGIPVLADAIPSYEPLGAFAYLNQWTEGLRAIIECRDEVYKRTLLGQAHVRARYNDEAIADQWHEAIAMVGSPRLTSPGPNIRTSNPIISGPLQSEPHAPSQGSADFLSSKKEIETLRSLPLRARLLGIPFERLVSKLKIERGLFETPDQQAVGSMCIIVQCSGNQTKSLRLTLRSIAVQSFPFMRVIFLGGMMDSGEIKRETEALESFPSWQIAADSDDLKASLREEEMCIMVGEGDILDPSVGSICSVIGIKSDFIAFSYATYKDRTCERATHILNLEPLSHDHAPVLRNAFAIRASRLKSYPGDLEREFRINNLHLLSVWLRRDPEVSPTVHPEILLLKPSINCDLNRAWFDDYQEAYSVLLSADLEFDFVEHATSDPAPFHIVPRTNPSGATVLIPFRDKAEMTLEAVRSISNYAGDFPVEVILIDNNSTAQSRRTISEGLKNIPDLDLRILEFPFPFNHSAQMNLGVRSARHDVIVFMNNDCKIESHGIFDELAAWALYQGIGTVGARVRNPNTSHASLGFVKRMSCKSFYDSPVEEMSQTLEFQTFTRRVFGNTFAFAAMSKAKYLEMGGLDPLHFPVGYNDVALAANCAEMGLRNLCLGHHVVSHAPGQSRVGTDESTQKIFLKALMRAPQNSLQEDYLLDTSMSNRSVFYS